jgi:hypothetical protein
MIRNKTAIAIVSTGSPRLPFLSNLTARLSHHLCEETS